MLLLISLGLFPYLINSSTFKPNTNLSSKAFPLITLFTYSLLLEPTSLIFYQRFSMTRLLITLLAKSLSLASRPTLGSNIRL